MFWDNFIVLCNQKGEAPNAVSKKLGFSNSACTYWKNGSTPRDTALRKIADYFGVTKSHLLDDRSYTWKIPAPVTDAAMRCDPEDKSYPLRGQDSQGDVPKSIHDQTAGVSATNVVFLEEKNIHMIPVFETVSAGFGAIAHDDIIDYTPLYFHSSAEASETICIRVKGDSMYPKIEENDIIAVRKQDSVDSGTIAVVLLDGEEGLVKRVEYGVGWVELHSINPMYKTMRFEGTDILRLRILGAVKKIIKSV